MIDYLNEFYSDSLLLGWAFLFFFGFYLLFAIADKSEQVANYNRARKILGLALIIWGVQVLIHWFFKCRESNVLIAAAVNLSIYFFCAQLMGYAFISLLNHKYISRKRVKFDIIKSILFAIVVWSAVLIAPETLTKPILYVTSAGFFIDVVILCKNFFKSYYGAKKQTEDFYSENVNHYIKWISNSVYFTIIAGLSGAILSFAPVWVATMYMMIGLLIFIYIFVSFQNYMVHYKYVDAVVVTDKDENVKENVITKTALKNIKLKIDEWIEQKGYLESSINVENLARSLGTNRTYLSTYINDEYSENFRQFISRLRINEAKELFLKKNINVTDVASNVGFSNASHFSRTFKQLENMSPQEWRNKNIS